MIVMAASDTHEASWILIVGIVAFALWALWFLWFRGGGRH